MESLELGLVRVQTPSDNVGASIKSKSLLPLLCLVRPRIIVGIRRGERRTRKGGCLDDAYSAESVAG